MKKLVPNAQPVELDGQQLSVVAAWQMMSCKLDWQALDAVIEYLQIQDVELLIDGLLVLHDYTINK